MGVGWGWGGLGCGLGLCWRWIARGLCDVRVWVHRAWSKMGGATHRVRNYYRVVMVIPSYTNRDSVTEWLR